MIVSESKKNESLIKNLESIYKNSLNIFNDAKLLEEDQKLKDALKNYEESNQLLLQIKNNIAQYKNHKNNDDHKWFNIVEEKNNKAIIVIQQYINNIKNLMNNNKSKNLRVNSNKNYKSNVMNRLIGGQSKDTENNEEKESEKTNESNKIDANNNENLYYLIDDQYKNFIDNNLIKPINYPELYKNNLNLLLIYGERGCGKSFIVNNTMKEINDKNSIKEYINLNDIMNKNKLNLTANLLMELTKINSYIFENEKVKEKKNIIIVIEDIDLIFDKNNHEDKIIIEQLYKISEYDNVFVIATSNSPWSIPKEINKLFPKNLHILRPSIEKIGRYFYYKIIDYISIKGFKKKYFSSDLFLVENKDKYNISIFDDKELLYRICKKCYDKKVNYHDLNIFINNLFKTTSLSAIQNNLFQKMEDDEIFFLSLFSVKSDNIKYDKFFVLNPPIYKEIIYDNDKKFEEKSNYHKILNIDDERIKNIYINTNDNIKHNKNINIIGEFEIEITNAVNDQKKNICKMNLFKDILNIYTYLSKNIMMKPYNIKSNNSKINHEKTKMTKHLDCIEKVNDLSDFLFLSRELINLLFENINKKTIINDYSSFKEKYSNCLNNLIQTISIKNFGKNDQAKFNLDYNGNSSSDIDEFKDGISLKYLEDPDKMKNIIKTLLKIDDKDIINDIKVKIETQYLKIDNGRSLQIIIKPNYQKDERLELSLFKIEIKGNKTGIEVDVSPSFNIPLDLIVLDENYKITNESDVYLLQEEFPEDYSEIYREEEESWFLKPIKKNEHFKYLQNYYNNYQIFYLNLFYNLIIYKVEFGEYLRLENKKNLTNVIKDLQYKIENLLLVEPAEDENDETVEIIWKLSSNHDDLRLDNINRYEIFKEQNKNSMDLLLYKNILEIFNESILEMFNHYLFSINGKYSKKRERVFVKSQIDQEKIKKYYYSNYLATNRIVENGSYNFQYYQILNKKIIRDKSFYFDLFLNAKEFGYLVKSKNEDDKRIDNINWFSIVNKNEELKNMLDSGLFAIQNRTVDFLFILIENISDNELLKNILTYMIILSIYSEKKINNILSLYIGLILYDKKITIEYCNNLNNLKLEKILAISIQKNLDNLVNRFNILKSKIKNIIIPKKINIGEILKKKEAGINKTFLEQNEECFKNPEMTDDERMKKLELYKKKIKDELKIDLEILKKSLRTFNIRIEYLEEIIDTFKNDINIEISNNINNFKNSNKKIQNSNDLD